MLAASVDTFGPSNPMSLSNILSDTYGQLVPPVSSSEERTGSCSVSSFDSTTCASRLCGLKRLHDFDKPALASSWSSVIVSELAIPDVHPSGIKCTPYWSATHGHLQHEIAFNDVKPGLNVNFVASALATTEPLSNRSPPSSTAQGAWYTNADFQLFDLSRIVPVDALTSVPSSCPRWTERPPQAPSDRGLPAKPMQQYCLLQAEGQKLVNDDLQSKHDRKTELFSLKTETQCRVKSEDQSNSSVALHSSFQPTHHLSTATNVLLHLPSATAHPHPRESKAAILLPINLSTAAETAGSCAKLLTVKAADAAQEATSKKRRTGGPRPPLVHSKYCHFCQHVKVSMVECCSARCTFTFCEHCLTSHLSETHEFALKNSKEGKWQCPCCRKACCCCSLDLCRKNHPHCKAYRKRLQFIGIKLPPFQKS